MGLRSDAAPPFNQRIPFSLPSRLLKAIRASGKPFGQSSSAGCVDTYRLHHPEPGRYT